MIGFLLWIGLWIGWHQHRVVVTFGLASF